MGVSKLRHTGDDQDAVKILSSSMPLSILLVPSLKEVTPFLISIVDLLLNVICLSPVLNQFMKAHIVAYYLLYNCFNVSLSSVCFNVLSFQILVN